MEDHERLQLKFENFLSANQWQYIRAGYHDFNPNTRLQTDFSEGALWVRSQPDLIAFNNNAQRYYEVKSKSPNYETYALEIHQFFTLRRMETQGAPVFYVFPECIMKPSEIIPYKVILRPSTLLEKEEAFARYLGITPIILKDGKFVDSFITMKKPAETGWYL